MTKRKRDEVEEAEIVVSDNVKSVDTKTLHKVSNSRLQFIILYSIIFVSLSLASGFTIYNEKKQSKALEEVKSKIGSLDPVVSLQTIDNRLNEFAVIARKENINRVDQAVKDIEKNLIKRISSLSELQNSSKIINLIRAETAEIQLKLEKEISDIKILNNENTEYQNTNGASELDIKTKLDNLDERLQEKEDIFMQNIQQIEQELLIIKKTLAGLQSSDSIRLSTATVLDMELLSALKESFVKIAHEALKMEAKRKIGGNPWSTLVSTLKSIFIFRSTTPKEGPDTDSILSRAEYELHRGNLIGCLKELTALEKDLAELFYEWKKRLNQLINKTNY